MSEIPPRDTGLLELPLSDETLDHSVYKTLLESTKAIPWKIDWKTLQFAYIGPQIEALLGWTPESWVSVDDWATRMHPEDRDWVVNFCVSQSRQGTDHEADYRALTRDGDYVWIRDVVHVVRDAEGEVEALVGFMFDISERKAYEEELTRLQRELEAYSYQDGLTGVANRRRLDDNLSQAWEEARRNTQPLSLIMIDIDHFKEYNDHYGHLAGDEALKRVAEALSRVATRPRDSFARFGGEEFMWVLPETPAEAAQQLAERCRREIFKLQLPHAASPVGCVTVSQGVATRIPAFGDTLPSLLEQVDRQLYLAKQGGRNRFSAVG
ncbi:sensor domain-containing diguanylate cyclase [Halomonas sp. ML-15]|uniref:sensor domain-containing diguanylate cyclase n=1 Tax=Halomonas sp. ML-15 TaxID=2773305 RepID=UPI0017473E83|nr:sensor domain-containing diguanylate cyclase [Halomonas sp. ML-15]MBD3896541.1 sensor domain-containing diguanylate cyclase [Halomonas sp. ML-15]